MKKPIFFLTVLIVAQIALAVGLHFSGVDVSHRNSDTPLLKINVAQVDQVTIEGPDKAKVVLQKAGSLWQLPGQNNFPADREKLDKLVDKLEEIRLEPPVATSSNALARLKVTDDLFERRIVFSGAGKVLTTLYLGTSASTHRVHARTTELKDVYAIDFPLRALPVTLSDWEDKSTLMLPKDKIVAIEASGLRLYQAPDTSTAIASKDAKGSVDKTEKHADDARTWLANNLTSSENLNAEAADTLVTVLAELSFEQVLGREDKPEYELAKPALILSVTQKDGNKIEYRLGKKVEGVTADKEFYSLKLSNRPEYFRLPSYVGARLLNASKREALVIKK